jgi:Ca2+-binding RTX toxin-like protein
MQPVWECIIMPSPSQLTQANFDLLQVINTGYLPETTLPLGLGTAGNDFFTSAAILILGNNGNDRIMGTNNPLLQAINGGEGSDQIFGMGGQDNINGGNGNDFIEGGAGGSALLKEVLDGGAGIDTLSYENSGAGVTVDLRPGTGGNIVMATGGDATFDTVKATFENFVGSAFNDTVHGTIGVNVLFGLAGNDTIHGHQGNDTLLGGAGADHLFGDDGNDILRGGAGADQLNGGEGDDTADYSTSSAGVTVNLDTGVGSGGDAQGDTLSNIQDITGSNFNDFITGNFGDDPFRGNTLRGGGGDDVIWGDPQQQGQTIAGDVIIGGAGADEIHTRFGGFDDSADTIVYEKVNDSAIDSTDILYMKPIDFIDLHLIDAIPGGADDAFVLGLLQAGQPGRLQVDVLQGSIEGDTTGDGVADFGIGIFDSNRYFGGVDYITL